MKFSCQRINVLIFLTIFLSGSGCSGPGPAKSGAEASAASAAARDSVLPLYAGTSSPSASAGAPSPNTPAGATAQPKTTKAEEFESTEPDLKTVLNDYYKDCRDTVRADTQILYKGQPLHIRFQHYSTNDSLVHLPLEYCKLWGLKKFTDVGIPVHLEYLYSGKLETKDEYH